MNSILYKALDIIKTREEYYEEEAHATNNYDVKMDCLSRASAYNSAWWILRYAIDGDWECLNQFNIDD